MPPDGRHCSHGSEEIFEKIERNCNISGESDKDEHNFSIEQYEIYQGVSDDAKRDSENITNSTLNKSGRKNLTNVIKKIKRNSLILFFRNIPIRIIKKIYKIKK